MLKKEELRILKLLFEDLNRDLTISDISRILKKGYFQAYSNVHSLAKSGDVTLKKVGNSTVVKLTLTELKQNNVLAEVERANDACKNITLKIIRKNIQQMNKNFICILFGSQTKNPNEKSDIDLLFIISDEWDYSKFEILAHNQLIAYNCDINITSERGMLEMLSNPKKFNVGNEVLKKHIVLYGAEYFLNLLRRYYVG